MANYKLLIPFIEQWEGGFINDPLDKGGATNKGITLTTYTDYRKKQGLPAPTIEELKNITVAEWVDIFKTLYWDRWQADNINNQSIANILVDWVWCSGKYGITIPQKIVGVTADGIAGNITLAAVNKQDPETLFNAIVEARYKYINDICIRTPTNERFRKGWVNRLKAIKFLP